MRTKGIVKSMGVIAAGVSVLLLCGAPCFAASVPAYAGNGAPQESTCLQFYAGGGVINSCGSQQLYEVPLAATPGVSHTVTVATNNPGGGTFSCTLYAASRTGKTLVTGTNFRPNLGYNVFSLSVAVPANGTMYLYCNINPGGIVHTVNYDE
jgi:hypothetical protein